MVSILCGNCQQTHGSVEDVRICHQAAPSLTIDARDLPDEPVDHRSAPGSDDAFVGAMRETKPVAEVKPVTVGMYKVDDVIYKVVRSRTSGFNYAQRLEMKNDGSYKFEYEAGAIKFITAEHRLTLAEAQEYGIRTGICCVCGRLLTNPESIALGIGPVCAGRF